MNTEQLTTLERKIERFSHILEQKPGDGLTVLALAEATFRRGLKLEALTSYQEVTKEKPVPEAHLAVAEIYSQQNMVNEAYGELSKLFEIDPDSVEARLLAHILTEEADPPEEIAEILAQPTSDEAFDEARLRLQIQLTIHNRDLQERTRNVTLEPGVVIHEYYVEEAKKKLIEVQEMLRKMQDLRRHNEELRLAPRPEPVSAQGASEEVEEPLITENAGLPADPAPGEADPEPALPGAVDEQVAAAMTLATELPQAQDWNQNAEAAAIGEEPSAQPVDAVPSPDAVSFPTVEPETTLEPVASPEPVASGQPIVEIEPVGSAYEPSAELEPAAPPAVEPPASTYEPSASTEAQGSIYEPAQGTESQELALQSAGEAEAQAATFPPAGATEAQAPTFQPAGTAEAQALAFQPAGESEAQPPVFQAPGVTEDQPPVAIEDQTSSYESTAPSYEQAEPVYNEPSHPGEVSTPSEPVSPVEVDSAPVPEPMPLSAEAQTSESQSDSFPDEHPSLEPQSPSAYASHEPVPEAAQPVADAYPQPSPILEPPLIEPSLEPELPDESEMEPPSQSQIEISIGSSVELDAPAPVPAAPDEHLVLQSPALEPDLPEEAPSSPSVPPEPHYAPQVAPEAPRQEDYKMPIDLGVDSLVSPDLPDETVVSEPNVLATAEEPPQTEPVSPVSEPMSLEAPPEPEPEPIVEATPVAAVSSAARWAERQAYYESKAEELGKLTGTLARTRGVTSIFLVSRDGMTIDSVVKDDVTEERIGELVKESFEFLLAYAKNPAYWVLECTGGIFVMQTLDERHVLIAVGQAGANFGALRYTMDKTKAKFATILDNVPQ